MILRPDNGDLRKGGGNALRKQGAEPAGETGGRGERVLQVFQRRNMNRIIRGGRPGKEDQPGKEQQIQQQAEDQQQAAQPEQPISIRVLAQSAFQVQPEAAADPPVGPGQQENHNRDEEGDQNIDFDTVKIHQRVSFSGGSRDLTR